MTQVAHTIRIFIGSPGDVAEERKQAFQIIEKLNDDPLLTDGWRIEPIGWDRTSYANTTWLSPQKAIDGSLPRPSECDIALFVLWNRIGTPLSDVDYPRDTRPEGPDRAPTGTEWEFFDAMASGEKTGRPNVLTFRCQRERTAKGGSDYQALFFQWQGVDAFFERFKDEAGSFRWSCTDYGNIEDFADKLNVQLRDAVQTLIKIGSGKKRKGKPPSEPKGPNVPTEYLRWLREEDTRIPLLGLDPKKPNTARLPQVYVPALTQARKRKPQEDKDERPYDLLLERLNTESLYVPGAPGAGKSVFCRWVAWVVAAGRMGEHAGEEPEEYRESLPQALQGKLPLFVRLREFHGYVDCGRDAGHWSCKQLEDALAAWLDKIRPGGLQAETFQRNLEAGNCLLLLDGMDEVPVSRETAGEILYPRKALISGLADALGPWKKTGNRILLTSRPYGLAPEDTQMLGLPEASLATLPDALQQVFVARWFAAVDPVEAEPNTRGLLEQLGERPQLAELTGSPVLLNALCVKYDDGHRLPRDTYELYSSIVDRVLHNRYLDRINEVEAVRRRLGAVALGMHTGEAVGQARNEPVAEIGHDELDTILAQYAERDPSKAVGADDAAAGRDELLARSGLLQSTGQRRAGFYHLTFQEFLAAERIARSRLSDRDGLRRLILEHAAKPEWHRTLLFLFAALWERAEPAQALDCFAPLRRQLGTERLKQDPNPAYLLGDCLEIVHAKESRTPDLDSAYRNACLAALEADLSPEIRARLFDALGRAGLDNRFGVGLDQNGLPAFDWIAIPGGTVELEDEGGTHVVAPFHIARYPVTQTQFNAFVKAEDGFRNPAWWDEGWIEQGWADPERPPKAYWSVPNRPMEQVSWHEALAFCRWLSTRVEYEVRLPTEMEWQQAATGGNPKNRYPWGGEYQSGYANIDETELGAGSLYLEATTSVGIYPLGASPQGALDLSGNVWEWCLNKHDDPADLSPGGQDLRSRRGGSWIVFQDFARAAYRGSSHPDNRNDDIGFRVCCVSPINEH